MTVFLRVEVALFLVVKVFLALVVFLEETALFFHLHLPHSVNLWVRFAWLVILGSASSTVLGIALAGIIKSGRGAPAVVSPFVIVLQFVSGVFFVFSSLPKWMQDFASIFPLKWLTQGMRSVFLPANFALKEPAGTWEIGKIALVLVIWLVVGTLLAIRSFKWSRQ